MSAPESKTRELFEKLANTAHRRSLTADRIFRQLRKAEAEAGAKDAKKTGPA